MLPIIYCALLMFATSCHGKPYYSKHIAVEFVPNVKQIEQATSGVQLKPNNVGINVQSTTSPDFSSLHDELGQKELGNEIDQEIYDQIFGIDSDTGVESSTKRSSESNLNNPTGVEPTVQNVNKEGGPIDELQKENSGVGLIDIRSNDKVLGIQDTSGSGQHGQRIRPDSQNHGPQKPYFGTSSNIPYGFEDNSNVGYNNVGFSSTPDSVTNGLHTVESSTTPSFKVGTKNSQPSVGPTYPVFRPINYPITTPRNQDGSGQTGVNPFYPFVRRENGDENSQPGVNPTYPITKSGNQDESAQPGVNPTYPITRPGHQDGSGQIGVNPFYPFTRPENGGGNSQPGVNPTYPITKPGNQDGSGQPGVNPTYPITRPGHQDGSGQPGVNPFYPFTRPENGGGNSQPGVNPTYPITKPGNQYGSRQPGVNPTYPNTRPGNQDGSSHSGVNPTYENTRPENQGGSSQHGVISNRPNRPGNQGNQPGVRPTYPIRRPGNQGGRIQPEVNPTNPFYGSGNQGTLYWPNIQSGVPTGPGNQGGVPFVGAGYWPDVQFYGYYSPDFMPQGQDGFHHGWFGNGQGYFNGYPNGPQYGWPYSQNTYGYGNGWLGPSGQDTGPANHNHGRFNGQGHHHSHHHHQHPGNEHHGYQFHYNHKDC